MQLEVQLQDEVEFQAEVEYWDEEMGNLDTSDVDARDEEMDDAERSEREEIRKPRIPASTSALFHAIPAVDLPDAVLFSATSLTPRPVSASCIYSVAARYLTEVPAVNMVDYVFGFSTTPLRPVHWVLVRCPVLY